MFGPPALVKAQDDVTLQLTNVLVASIPPQVANVLMKALSTQLPIKHLQHLKRIRKPAGESTLDIIICAMDTEIIPAAASALIAQHNLQTKVVQVPATPPQTREQLAEWTAVWPTSWKIPEGGATAQAALHSDEAAWWQQLMDHAMSRMLQCKSGNYAIIADPKTRQIMGEAASGAHLNPLHHPVMLAVHETAVNEAADWLRKGEVFQHAGRSSISRPTSHPEHQHASTTSHHHAPASPSHAYTPTNNTTTTTTAPTATLPSNTTSQPHPPDHFNPHTSDLSIPTSKHHHPPPSTNPSASSLAPSHHPLPCRTAHLPQPQQPPSSPSHPHPTAKPSPTSILYSTKRPKLAPTPLPTSLSPPTPNSDPATTTTLTPAHTTASTTTTTTTSTTDPTTVAIASTLTTGPAPTPHTSPAPLPPIDPRTRQYLCTGFDCIVVREPCSMCAMALVHSRMQRVVWALPDPLHGVLGSRLRLHGVRSLNHHYQVYHLPPADST